MASNVGCIRKLPHISIKNFDKKTKANRGVKMMFGDDDFDEEDEDIDEEEEDEEWDEEEEDWEDEEEEEEEEEEE